jgi:metallophosphoesterase superfamily enzyme
VLIDSLGTRSNEKCWVRARLNEKLVRERYQSCPKELVIVPAFNPLLTGTPVNSSRGSMIGPFFRNGFIDSQTIRTYLLDGTNLGRP